MERLFALFSALWIWMARRHHPFDKLVLLHQALGTQIEEAKIARARPLN